MATKEKALRNILGSDATDRSVQAQAILEVLNTAANDEEKAQLLSIVLTERDRVEKNAQVLSNKGVSDEVWEQLSKFHYDAISSHLTMAFFKSHSALDFSKHVVRMLNLFDVDDEKTYALATTISSRFIPFKELPGEPVRMSSHQFQHIIESHREKSDLIKYILKVPFPSKAELASMILQVVDDEPERTTRVALLAYSLILHQERIEKSVKAEYE